MDHDVAARTAPNPGLKTIFAISGSSKLLRSFKDKLEVSRIPRHGPDDCKIVGVLLKLNLRHQYMYVIYIYIYLFVYPRKGHLK